MTALHERLIAARKAAKVSQDAAAKELGMSRPTYIAIEKGLREIKSSELIALAKLFGTQVSKLVRQDAPPPQIAPHMRGEIPSSSDDAGVSEAIDKLSELVDDYQFLLEKTNARLIPVISPPKIDESTVPIEHVASRVAQRERSNLGFGEREPIGDLRKTLDEVGVHVFADELKSTLAGIYAFVQGFGYCILVNRVHPLVRMRWTVAHEYGHFLFDRDKPGVDYLSSPVRRPKGESFADSFASNFLMPAEGVRRHFEDAKQRTGDVNVGDLCRIADFYKVSLMAMTLRMEALKLIPSGTWDFLSESGVKVSDLRQAAGVEDMVLKREPIEMFPERYLQLAIQAWNSGSITTSQFAKLLRRSPMEARELAESKSQSNEDGVVLNLRLSESLLERGNAH